MIIENIINELDSFLTKYKALKTDNQSLTQFKSEVKTALNSKGIIHTNEDSEVVNSVNSYTPPTGGGTTLDSNYLKSKGLLPYNFSGTPTVEDLKSTKFIVQDRTAPNKFISSSTLSSVKVTLNGVETTDFIMSRESANYNNSSIDSDKFIITNSGYWINEFKFNTKGTYKVLLGTDGATLEKDINFDPNNITSMSDYLLYAVNIKTGKVACYDSGTNVEMTGNLDSTKVSLPTSTLITKVRGNLDSMNSSSERFGYVLNLRTGLAYYLNVFWDIDAFSKVDARLRRALTTTIYNNTVEVITDRYSFALHAVTYKNDGNIVRQDVNNFINDIDYKDGDTLVFAFYKTRDSVKAHELSREGVATYLKNLFKDINLQA